MMTARDGSIILAGAVVAAILALALLLLSASARAQAVLGTRDAGQCGGPDGGFIEGQPPPTCGDWLNDARCATDMGVDAGDGSESCFCYGPCTHQRCFAHNVECIEDEQRARRAGH